MPMLELYRANVMWSSIQDIFLKDDANNAQLTGGSAQPFLVNLTKAALTTKLQTIRFNIAKNKVTTFH